jgi:uncharacterized protein
MNGYIFLVLLFFAGFVASFINVMAGGGSVLTLGLMMLFGIDPATANGTNRIGILVGGLSGTLAFKAEKVSDFKKSMSLAAFAIPGAIFGAYYSVQINEVWFQRIFAVIIIFILFTLIKSKKKESPTKEVSKLKKVLIYPVMFLIGFYGGFIQVGIGFILITALRNLLEAGLVKVNMHKLFIILTYSVPVIVVFGITGNINWLYAICLAAGNATGAWVSAKISVKKGEPIVKIVLAATIIIMAAKFMFSL